MVRLWVFTYRVRFVAPGGVPRGAAVFGFWHGQQMALLAVRKAAGDGTVLVSRSRDGELQSGVMTALGFRVVRGSSSRGGARALAELVALLRSGVRVLLAVDGPRGPRDVAKAGAAAAANAAKASLYPVASAARRVWVLSKTWDRFEIPWPFSRVAVVVGAPMPPAEVRARPELLGLALSACRAEAERVAGIPAVSESTPSEVRA